MISVYLLLDLSSGEKMVVGKWGVRIIFTFEMFYRDADTPPWLKEQCGHCD